MTTPLLAGTYGAGTYGAGVYGVGETDATPVEPGAPTDLPVAGESYVLRFFPTVNGRPTDVTSVDRIDLYPTADRTGTPSLTVLGPAARTGLGAYAFAAAVMPAAGVYYAAVTYTVGGSVLTDSNDTLAVFAFDGGLAPTAGLVTVDEARPFAPKAPSQPDEVYAADLTTLIAAVSNHLVREYGAPRPGTVTKRFRCSRGGPIILPLGASVTAVSAQGQTLTGWDHDEGAGLLHDVYAYYGSVSVTYSTPLLPEVREAVLLTVQHAWESRWGANPVPFQSGIDESYTASRGFFVPNRAKELLRPFRAWVA